MPPEVLKGRDRGTELGVINDNTFPPKSEEKATHRMATAWPSSHGEETDAKLKSPVIKRMKSQ